MRELIRLKYTVDIKATQSYLDMYNKPCECIICKNYFKTFETIYPEVIEVLNKLGIIVQYPLQIIDCFWNDKEDKRLYESYYSVKGELFEDKTILYDKDVIITLYQPDTDEPIYGNTGMKKPYFIVGITNIELPWVLDEMPED